MKVDVIKVDATKRERMQDEVVREVPLTISIGKKELVTLLCSPDSLKELCIGFLFSSGLIRSYAAIKDIVIDTQRWAAYIKLKKDIKDTSFTFKRVYTPGCGKGILFYKVSDLVHTSRLRTDIKISSEKVTRLANAFQKQSQLFRQTGGVHSAAWCDTDTILVCKEDIGRHNAVDKIVGEALLQGLDMSRLILLSSGRISSEILYKVHKSVVSIAVSRSAPTDQAVKLANTWGMTLVGFARGQRMNIYSGADRII